MMIRKSSGKVELFLYWYRFNPWWRWWVCSSGRRPVPHFSDEQPSGSKKSHLHRRLDRKTLLPRNGLGHGTRTKQTRSVKVYLVLCMDFPFSLNLRYVIGLNQKIKKQKSWSRLPPPPLPLRVHPFLLHCFDLVLQAVWLSRFTPRCLPQHLPSPQSPAQALCSHSREKGPTSNNSPWHSTSPTQILTQSAAKDEKWQKSQNKNQSRRPIFLLDTLTPFWFDPSLLPQP